MRRRRGQGLEIEGEREEALTVGWEDAVAVFKGTAYRKATTPLKNLQGCLDIAIARPHTLTEFIGPRDSLALTSALLPTTTTIDIA